VSLNIHLTIGSKAVSIREHFHEMPEGCPIKPGKYYENVTLIDIPNPKTATPEQIIASQKVKFAI
jgi:hypothetical protein